MQTCLSLAHECNHIVQQSTKHIITTTHSSHLHYDVKSVWRRCYNTHSDIDKSMQLEGELFGNDDTLPHHNYRVNKLPWLTVRLLLLFYGGVVTTITAARHGWAISIGSITLLGKRAPVMLSFCWTKIAVARWRACK